MAIDPLICPLCGQQNACVNLSCDDQGKTCWCNSPEITFPEELLKQVPDEAKAKACVCYACASAYSLDKQNQT